MNIHSVFSDDDVLNQFTQQLKAQLGDHLQQLVLFGSRARGDHMPDSDYDFLAVLDEISPGLDETIYELGGEFLYQHCAVVSVIPVTREEYDRRIYNPLFMNIRKEGIVL